mgnify:CR=1 FL=1
MKKIIIGTGLIAISLMAMLKFFTRMEPVNITCEIRERTKDTEAISSPITSLVHLHSEDAQNPDSIIVASQIVKDIKIHLSMNKASFDMFRLFDIQLVENAWQITQEFEDLKLGTRTDSYSIVSTLFGMPKTSNIKFFNRSNGDTVSADCFQDRMIPKSL